MKFFISKIMKCTRKIKQKDKQKYTKIKNIHTNIYLCITRGKYVIKNSMKILYLIKIILKDIYIIDVVYAYSTYIYNTHLSKKYICTYIFVYL